MDLQNNIENITIRQVGYDTYNVTFTRFDNTNDLNDVIITKVKRVFIMTQRQKQIQEQQNKLNQNTETLIESDLKKVNLEEQSAGKIENEHKIETIETQNVNKIDVNAEEKESILGPNHLLHSR